MSHPRINLFKYYTDKLDLKIESDGRASFHDMACTVKVINLVTQHSYAIKRHHADVKEGIIKAVAMVSTADKTQQGILEGACNDPTRNNITTATIKWNTHVEDSK